MPKIMKPLTLAECLESNYVRVLDHEHPHNLHNSIYAVFLDSVKNGPFCGLLTLNDIALHPGWIFADLVEHRPNYAIALDTSIKEALLSMEKHDVRALPVLDREGKFHGVITHTSILLGLLQREKAGTKKIKQQNREIDQDRKQLAAWSARLVKLHEASRTLLGILSHTSLESDLLQHGIKAITQLLETHYGAIGIVNDKGELLQFVYTGIAPEQAQQIKDLPKGRGLLGVVIREDHAIRLDDMTKDPRSAGFPPGHPPMKTLLAVPISYDGRIYGRIYVCDKIDGSAFTADDELLTMSFSHSLALTLSNAHEINTIKIAQERLDYLAHFDPLTGLPNRKLLVDRIQQIISNCRRYQRKMAVLFIDLDNFKSVNDGFGHDVGDNLLKQIARIISTLLRDGDTVAHLSGDEFIVLLSEIANPQDAASVAEKILSAVKEPIHPDNLSDREIFITASIGIGIYPQDGEDKETLMTNADTAMYHAKSAGKNLFKFFSPSLNRITQRHLKMEQHLQQALNRNELTLHYQPQININTKKIIGVEALLRWQNQEIGNVSPADFIPIAEETGLIVPIGSWVLRSACMQGMQWQKDGLDPMHIAVNISSRQIQHNTDFLQTLKLILNETGLSPDMLELEITESIMLQDIETTIKMLHEIKNLGVRFSMDDFGTGYSSLSYLKRLPLDAIKIDQIFIQDIVTDRNDAAIVAAISVMARQLNLELVAEGVETKEQLDIIRTHQCEIIQGYYFSKPVCAEEMTKMLQRGSV